MVRGNKMGRPSSDKKSLHAVSFISCTAVRLGVCPHSKRVITEKRGYQDLCVQTTHSPGIVRAACLAGGMSRVALLDLIIEVSVELWNTSVGACWWFPSH